MTLKLYFIYGIMFLLGQVLHIYWIKIPNSKLRAAMANKPFSYKEWWDCDKNLIIGLNILGMTLLIGLDQLIVFAPDWVNKLKWGFWLVGTFGSTVGYKFYKGYDSGTMKLMDIKSNIADIVTGGATNVRDAIEKGTAATGADVTKPPSQ